MLAADNVANSSPARAEARLRGITACRVGKLCGRFEEIHGSRVWALLRIDVEGVFGYGPQAFEVYGVVYKGVLLPQQIRLSSPAPVCKR